MPATSNFRQSIGSLSVPVEQELELNPFGSALYIFINRKRNKIKGLYWHRNGFCLWLKRLNRRNSHGRGTPMGHTDGQFAGVRVALC